MSGIDDIVREHEARDDIIQGLADCPRGSRYWAAMAYRLGLMHGRSDVLVELEIAGRDLLAAARPVLRQPHWDEIQGRRDPDFTPCPARCRKCSRCIASLAYWSRGGRPFEGVDREAELTRGDAA